MAEDIQYTIATYYKFVPIDNVTAVKAELLALCNQFNIKGTILLAEEGINATIAGTNDDVINFMGHLKKIVIFEDIQYKSSSAAFVPFKKMKIRLKQEIVRMRYNIDMQETSPGHYLNAEEWDALIKEKGVVLIDTRNHYEVAFGSFKGAIDPHTQNFSDFPEWFEKYVNLNDKEQKIAMFCTGGIRCEKSTAYVKKLGFKNVYHLKGGILKYFEEKLGKPNMWEGNLFLFDDRIAINHNLEPLNNDAV